MMEDGYTIYFNNRPIGSSLIDIGYEGSYFIEMNKLNFHLINFWGEHESINFYLTEQKIELTFDNGNPTEYYKLHELSERVQEAVLKTQEELGWL